MKNKLCIIIFSISIALTACSNSDPSRSISKKIGLEISSDVVISSNSSEPSFHGDGYKVTSIIFNEDDGKKLTDTIKLNEKWSELPLSENLELIMYGGKKGNRRYSYNLAKEAYIPNIENGYWIFIDRNDESNGEGNDKELFDRHSFNFTLAIYDEDNSILYYFEYDT